MGRLAGYREAPMDDFGADELTFDCPRCASSAAARFYGPCPACRDELRATQGTAGRDDIVAEAYEPKMNVTPNAVALKE
jgi:hypothetical protein